MNTFDICIIITAVVIIAIILIININNILEKKMSNVAVNIPPITIPNPQVIVKIQKTCNSENYDVFIDSDNKGQPSQVVSLSPIEHFETPSNMQDSEKSFVEKIEDKIEYDKKQEDDIKKNARENYKKIRDEDVKINKESVEDQQKKLELVQSKDVSLTSEKHVKFPDYKQEIEYGDYKCTKKSSPVNVSSESNKNKTCENKSIVNRQYDNAQYMLKNSKDMENITFPICSNIERNNINDVDIDPQEHYRKYQTFVRAYLEDPVLGASNIDKYQEVSPIFKSGKIPLDDNFKYPKPSGYIFESSPTFKKY